MERAQQMVSPSSPRVSVEADFQEDLRLHYLSELAKLGVPPPKAADDVFSACSGYFNVRFRLIPKRPRRALKSRELLRRKLSHRQRSRLGAIVKEIETGTDLRPRLSKNVLRPDYSDKLLQDWGIQHLHVGPHHDAHGPELLYVYFTSDSAHLIDWQEHGVGSFADQALMEILHDNWPAAIEHETSGFVPDTLEPSDLTPAERQLLRAKFTLCTQVADGTIYLPLGGGSTMAGSSSRVTRWVQRERQLAQNVHEWVVKNAVPIQSAIVKKTAKPLEVLKLRYIVGQPLRVQEQQTNIVVNLPEEESG